MKSKICYFRTNQILVTFLALVLSLGRAQELGATLTQSIENPRWEFLRTNLSIFPGTENLFEPDPKLFWRLRPDLRDVQAAERLPHGEWRFSVSTDGNGRRLGSRPKAPRHRILFLGDSCTFGIPVDDHETFPALVEKIMEGIESINAGVPGYSAFQGRLLLEKWAPSFTPDIVVVTFWPNDRSVWDHLGDAEHQEFIAAQQSGEFSRYQILRLLRRAGPGDRRRLTEEEFAEEIRRIIRWSRTRGVEPVLQIWPTRQQMASLSEIDYQAILRRIGGEDRVRIIDLVSVFRTRRDGGLFVDNIHASRAGYAVVAETLVPILKEILRTPAKDGGKARR
jgi:lysophospholipase L1-like esterase